MGWRLYPKAGALGWYMSPLWGLHTELLEDTPSGLSDGLLRTWQTKARRADISKPKALALGKDVQSFPTGNPEGVTLLPDKQFIILYSLTF